MTMIFVSEKSQSYAHYRKVASARWYRNLMTPRSVARETFHGKKQKLSQNFRYVFLLLPCSGRHFLAGLVLNKDSFLWHPVTSRGIGLGFHRQSLGITDSVLLREVSTNATKTEPYVIHSTEWTIIHTIIEVEVFLKWLTPIMNVQSWVWPHSSPETKRPWLQKHWPALPSF